MCNHKPKFFKFYFANRYLRAPDKIEKECYICKHCEEKIGIDKKYIPYEIVIRIFKWYLFLFIPFIFSFWSYYNDNMELRWLMLIIAIIAYFLLEFVIESLFYLILKFNIISTCSE